MRSKNDEAISEICCLLRLETHSWFMMVKPAESIISTWAAAYKTRQAIFYSYQIDLHNAVYICHVLTSPPYAFLRNDSILRLSLQVPLNPHGAHNF